VNKKVKLMNPNKEKEIGIALSKQSIKSDFVTLSAGLVRPFFRK